MSDSNNANGSGTPKDSGTGGADEKNPPANKPDDPPKDKTVSYENYSRAVDQVKRWKQEAEEAKNKLTEIENARVRAEQEQLEKEGQWQKLAESRTEELKKVQKEVDDWKQKFSGLDSQIKDSRKAHAVASKLNGTLRQDYFHMLDLDSVVMNPDTGEIDEASAVKTAELFSQKYPELITPVNTPNLPNGQPRISGNGGMVSYDEYKRLPYAEKRKVLDEKRLQRGSRSAR